MLCPGETEGTVTDTFCPEREQDTGDAGSERGFASFFFMPFVYQERPVSSSMSPAGVPKVSFDITTTASRGTAKSPKKVVSGSCIHYIISLKNKDKNFAIGTALVTDVIPQGLTLDPSRITYYRNDAATAAVPVSAGDGSVQAAFDGSTLTLSLSGIPAGEKLSVVVPCEVTPQEAEELFINTPVLVSIDGAQVNTQASKPCYQVKSAGK